MAEEILINVNVEGEAEINNTGKGIENLGKKANKTQSELQKLRKELRDQKAAMLQAEEGTEEYGRALARASEIQQRITDVNKQVTAGMRGVGEMATRTASIVSGMGGGFSALTGVMNLFGVENEEVLKSIQRLQAVMSITQGLATFVDSIDAMQEFMSSLRASTAMAAGEVDNMKKPVTELSTAAGDAGDNFSRLTKESAVLGSNIAGVQSVSETAKKGIDGISESSKSAAETVRSASAKFDEFKKKMDEMGLQQRTRVPGEGFVGGAFNVPPGAEERIKAAQAAEAEAAKKSAEAAEKLAESKDKASDATEKLEDATKKTGGTLLKTIGIMGGLTIAITAAFFVIEKLIEYIYKIPDEVKLKFELEESVVKETQKALEEIAQIRQNITLTSNKKELDLLKEKLVAEGIATEEQLKGLNDSKALLNAAFWDEYIENVKLVAENEYLIRKDIELRLQKELAQIRVEELRKTQTYLQGFASIFGIGELPKAIDEVDRLTKEMETFQKTFYNSDGTLKLNKVKFDIKMPNAGGKPTTSPVIQQLYPYLTQKEIDDYVKDLAVRTNAAIRKEFGTGEYAGDARAARNSMVSAALGLADPKDLEANFIKIDEKRKAFLEKERDSFERQMDVYMSYADSLASIADAFVGIYDAKMQVIDNYYNAEAALIENSLLTEEEKNSRLAALDKERYEKQKAMFDKQKDWQRAFVYLNLASGLMNVYTRATLPVAMGGAPSPFNWIQAGLETTALIGQSVASIAQINAQQLESPSGTSAGGGAGASLQALNPTKTALTTKEENLNMMQKASISENLSIVRVSEINDVQNRVKVRESNSSF